MLGGEPPSYPPQEKLDSRSFLLIGPGGSTLHSSRGHSGRSGKSAERQYLGYLSLLGTLSGVLWGYLARAGLVNSKERGFGKPH